MGAYLGKARGQGLKEKQVPAQKCYGDENSVDAYSTVWG